MIKIRKKFVRYPQVALLIGAVMVLGYVIVSARAQGIAGDINNDGKVDVFDLSILLSDWGTNNASADLNHDGTVNIFDLSTLLSHWGQTGPTPTPTPTPTPAPGAYSVSGNKILNSSGQQVLVHGVDRPSLEWGCGGSTVTNGPGPIPATDFTTMRNAWNASAVRLALDQDFWLTGANRYCSSYRSNVDTAIKNARAAGLIVILDLHWSDMGNISNSSPGQQCMADQNSVTFWQQVAAIYKSDPNVWFELYNEPHDIDWNTWLNGGPICGFTAVGMQALYNSVRGAGANNIVIAGGREWASQLSGAPKLTGTNVAYAIHIYRQGTGFSTSGWDSQFGTFSATAPVISTEFGDQVCDGTTFDQQFLNYLHAHSVGYTGWAWFVQGCTWPSLITDAAGTCNTAYAGCAIQADMKKQP